MPPVRVIRLMANAGPIAPSIKGSGEIMSAEAPLFTFIDQPVCCFFFHVIGAAIVLTAPGSPPPSISSALVALASVSEPSVVGAATFFIIGATVMFSISIANSLPLSRIGLSDSNVHGGVRSAHGPISAGLKPRMSEAMT